MQPRARQGTGARRGGAAARSVSLPDISSYAAQADAEANLRNRCSQKGITFTTLRLGALIDSAGGVPLAFGEGDSLLVESLSTERGSEPPLISRNDAARLVVETLCSGLPRLGGATVDAAWAHKWSLSSAGTEEAARTAARQDLITDCVDAIREAPGATASTA